MAQLLSELLLAYLKHAKQAYGESKRGEYYKVKLAVRPLRRLYGPVGVLQFGVLQWKNIRQYVLDGKNGKEGDPIRVPTRRYVNTFMQRVTRIFRWAAGDGDMYPGELALKLERIEPLKVGRTKARETDEIEGVPDETLEPWFARLVYRVARPEALRRAWALPDALEAFQFGSMGRACASRPRSYPDFTSEVGCRESLIRCSWRALFPCYRSERAIRSHFMWTRCVTRSHFIGTRCAIRAGCVTRAIEFYGTLRTTARLDRKPESVVAMRRRLFLVSGTGFVFLRPLFAMMNDDKFDEASSLLTNVTSTGQVRAAVAYARIGKTVFHRAFGEAKSTDVSFLLGSISKPIAVTALMTLFNQGKFQLSNAVRETIPEFIGNGRERVTIQHLLTHVSGLPDQLPENADLRRSHAPLSEFVKGIIKVPLRFEPGTQYEYSSMAIMLAIEIAQRISGIEFIEFVHKSVLQPLGMHQTAFGMGRLTRDRVMSCQVEFGAIESGGGSPDSKSWDWNSSYWRQLGAPWGGAHASASDIAIFLDEFMHPSGKIFRPDVAKLMIRNHNPAGMPTRGIGLDVGMSDVVQHASDQTFGHTGSTGTIAWADPIRDRVCVVLTTLPAGVLPDHVRKLASDSISRIVE